MMKLLSKAIFILCFFNGFCFGYYDIKLKTEDIRLNFFTSFSRCSFHSFDTQKEYIEKAYSNFLLFKKAYFNSLSFSSYYVDYEESEPFLKKYRYNDDYLFSVNHCNIVDLKTAYVESYNCDKTVMTVDCSFDVYKRFNISNDSFIKLFPLSFDLKKQLYELPAQQRKDFFCRAKFGGSVSYANNTRIMPFYSNLKLIKSNNIGLIDLDKRTNYFSFFKGKKGLVSFVGSAGFVAIKNFFELFTSGDTSYTMIPVEKLNQVCEFDCVDGSGNIQTATIPYYYDVETKSIFNEALAVCSNATMRYYDFVYDSLDEAVSISLRKDEIALLEAEQEKITQEYFLMQNKEYYNELLKEYYDPSLDETYSIYADTHILEQARATYQAKVFETEKNNLLDMLNKGGFSETSVDYYKKYLDDETIDKYRQAKIEADRRLEEILNGKDGGFKADENANSNIVTGVPPFEKDPPKDKTPPPPPLPPTNEKDGGFKGDNTANKGGAVGGGIGAGSGVGSIVGGGIVGGNVGSNANANTAEKDLTKDNAQDNAKEDTKEDTKENSKADDVTITKDSTTTVDKTQTGSKVDVNVKTDVNVDVNVKAKVDLADIPFDDTNDSDFSLDDIERELLKLDSLKNFFDDLISSLKRFIDIFGGILNKLEDTRLYFENLKKPYLVNTTYKNTCPFEKKLSLYGYDVPLSFDVCKFLSIIYPATFTLFYVFFFAMFFVFSYRLAKVFGIFKINLKL